MFPLFKLEKSDSREPAFFARSSEPDVDAVDFVSRLLVDPDELCVDLKLSDLVILRLNSSIISEVLDDFITSFDALESVDFFSSFSSDGLIFLSKEFDGECSGSVGGRGIFGGGLKLKNHFKFKFSIIQLTTHFGGVFFLAAGSAGGIRGFSEMIGTEFRI